jgi:hypothetical protein
MLMFYFGLGMRSWGGRGERKGVLKNERLDMKKKRGWMDDCMWAGSGVEWD